MVSLDTNLIFTAVNPADAQHSVAITFLRSWEARDDVVISELVLAEFYQLLRNPAINLRPLTAPQAAKAVEAYRHHPRWLLVGFPADSRHCHDAIWKKAAELGIAYRRLFDVRLAFSLIYQSVDEFATINVKDFHGLGFRRVWNPLVNA